MPVDTRSQIPSDVVLNIGGPAPAAPSQTPYSFALDPRIAGAVPPSAPQQDPSATLDTILQKLGAATVAPQAVPVQAPSTPAIPRGVQMTGTYKGKEWDIYTSTGDSHTAEEFDAAFGEYKRTGKAPKGYRVLEPGTMSNLRSAFETVRAPLRKAVEELDDPNLPLNRLLPGFVSAVPKFLARQIHEEVKTPERAAMFAATLAVAPFLGPVTKAVKVAGKLVPAFDTAGAALNIAKTVGATGVAGAAADVATGEPIDPRKFGVQLGMVALGSGFQGVVGHVVGNYIRPDLQAKVMDDLKNVIIKRYPDLANNPNAIDIAASSPDVLYQMGRQMSAGIRGTVDDIAERMLTDVNAVMPMRLSVGLQNTFRARTRDLARAGNAMLDATNDQAALKAATADFDAAKVAIGDLLKGEVATFIKTARPGIKDVQPMINKVSGTLKQYETHMSQFTEGAQVMGYLNRATQGKGFDINVMKDELLGAYGHNRTPLVKDVQDVLTGRTVGFPQSELTNLPTVTESIPNPNARAANFIKSILPVPNAVKALLPGGKTTATRTVLPYQIPQPAPAPLNIGSQLAGQEAVRDFMNRK
jgi:hypothetical protein